MIGNRREKEVHWLTRSALAGQREDSQLFGAATCEEGSTFMSVPLAGESSHRAGRPGAPTRSRPTLQEGKRPRSRPPTNSQATSASAARLLTLELLPPNCRPP